MEKPSITQRLETIRDAIERLPEEERSRIMTVAESGMHLVELAIETAMEEQQNRKEV